MNVEDRLARLTAEILRWNDHINLVSRVDATARVDELMDQCRRAWTAVEASLGGDQWFGKAAFVDIGSGAGLPGLVWAAEREAAGVGLGGLLVEPREKRAWFLNRCARMMGMASVAVAACRWGEGELADVELHADAAVLSLKALRLDDAEVLGGMGAVHGLSSARAAVILRFLPPEPPSVGELVGTFSAASLGGVEGWERIGAEILGVAPARLLSIRYHRPT